jgi:hypothetical protein
MAEVADWTATMPAAEPELDADGNPKPAAEPPAKQYQAGDKVTHGGGVWTCRFAHTAMAEWAPGNGNHLWGKS